METMDKRTFLKLSSAMMASPLLPSWVRAMTDEHLTNWAGNLTYETKNVFSAKSPNEARDFIKKQAKLKVLGTRHCFNNIADSKDYFLSMRQMLNTHLDEDTRTVTLESGMSYGQLAPQLEAKGYALHNLASLPHISIAGACSTATHGSGDKNGNLATAVTALEFISASGDTVRLSDKADGDKLRGAVVGLGALGAITRLTLSVEPTFQVRQFVYENLPVDQWKENFEAVESAAYSVSLFTDWAKPSFNEIWLKERISSDSKAAPPKEFFGATLATKNLHPIAELSPENCTQQMGVPGPWYERLPHFKMGFTPSAGKELQSEYFVPRQHAIDAVLAIGKMHEQITPHLLISEIRTIAADELWMSPCYKQDCVTIHFTWKQDWASVQKLLPVIEKELTPYDARPHWGKLFTTSPATLKTIYTRMPEFIALARNYDPQGKFRNDFLNKNIFG
jgi:alditol oxidase